MRPKLNPRASAALKLLRATENEILSALPEYGRPEDVDLLRLAMAMENASLLRRPGVVDAIEARIAELETGR